MMADIWVIEVGSYDYGMVGVFSTEENARRIADKLNATKEAWNREEYTVSNWPLDPGIEEMNQGLVGFRISMRRDGAVGFITQEDKFCERNLTTKIEADRNSPGVYGTVFARDEEHAIKIANEHRAQFIANGEL